MLVTVSSVRIPSHSPIGFLDGTDDAGNLVTLATDAKAARWIGSDLEAGEHVVIEPDARTNGITILSVTDPKEEPYQGSTHEA